MNKKIFIILGVSLFWVVAYAAVVRHVGETTIWDSTSSVTMNCPSALTGSSTRIGNGILNNELNANQKRITNALNGVDPQDVATVSQLSSSMGGMSTAVFRAYGYAGYGAVSTKIPRMTSTLTNTGEGWAWTYTTNANDGSFFTILPGGHGGAYVAYLSMWAADGENGVTGFSLNSSEGSTGIESINPTNRLGVTRITTSGAVTEGANSGIPMILASNDVIRAHTEGSVPGASHVNKCSLTLIKIR